jgi:hypothetical protein
MNYSNTLLYDVKFIVEETFGVLIGAKRFDSCSTLGNKYIIIIIITYNFYGR